MGTTGPISKREIEMEKNKTLYAFRTFKDELKRFKAIAAKKRTTASELLRVLMRNEIALAEVSIKPALQIAPEK